MKLYIKKDIDVRTIVFEDTRVWIDPSDCEIAEEDLKELLFDIGFAYNINDVPHSSRFRYMTGTETTYPFYESPYLAINLDGWEPVLTGENITLDKVAPGLEEAAVSKDSPYSKMNKLLPDLNLYVGGSWVIETDTAFVLVTLSISGDARTTKQILEGIDLKSDSQFRNKLVLITSDPLSNSYPPDFVSTLSKKLAQFDKHGDIIESAKPVLH